MKLGKCKDGGTCGLGGFCKDCHSVKESPEQVGAFIMENAKGKQCSDGTWYAYHEVEPLLKPTERE